MRHDGDAAADASPHLDAPMPGSVVLLAVADGARVEAGDPVVVVEAMEMEHVVRATTAGVVRLRVSVGDQVTRGQTLAMVLADEDPDGKGDGR